MTRLLAALIEVRNFHINLLLKSAGRTFQLAIATRLPIY